MYPVAPMPKLPADAHRKLAAAMVTGTIPEYGQPGYDDFFDVYGDLGVSLDGDWARAAASPARRHVSALSDLWNAIPADGLLVGVACNQPGVVAAAIDAVTAMKLPVAL